MTLLRSASLALLGFVAPASAEIVPKCQSLAQHFSEYFTTERANVRDKPSIKGSVVATLPPRTRVYASEEWRVWPRDADSWYILLASEDLPPVRKCAGGYIHPGLISKTRGSEKDVMNGPWTAYVAGIGQDLGSGYFGLAWGRRTEAEAVADARAACIRKGGADLVDNCHYAEAYKNKCIVVGEAHYTESLTGRRFSVDYPKVGDTESEAISRLRNDSDCGNCPIVANSCAR